MPRHWLLAMTRLQIIFLVALPLCTGQFSIQGPTDGNRRAQGLKYSQEKGIEYEDQRASLGAGDFSIQGATDGNSDFKIQGATDGNADFQIQGATDGNANFHIQGASDGNANFHIQGATDGNANFHIQGATDSNANFQIQGPSNGNANYQIQGAAAGHRQPAIQGAYDANQRPATPAALQYRDPSGLSVNWKSYHQLPPEVQATRNAFVPQDAPIPQPRQHIQRQQAAHRQPAQAQHQQAQAAQQPAVAAPNYRPYGNAPAQIKQLLQFQQQIPYLNIIPEQFRYEGLDAQVEQGPIVQPNNYRGKPQKAAARTEPDEQNQYRSQYRAKARGPPRQKRQTNQRQARQQHQQKSTQPPAEAQPQYSTNVPSRIQELLKFQSQIPYVNHIPEKWRYDALAAAQSQQQEFSSQYQHQQAAQPAQGEARHRQKRQAPQHEQSQIRQYRQHPQQPQQHEQSQIRQYRQHPQQQQHQQPQQPARQQPQYQRISQPPPEAQPHYSSNLPSQLQQLLKFQAQIPYVNSIPEKFRYENLAAAQAQHGGQAQPAPSQYRPQYQQEGHGAPRQKRQAPQHQQPQQQQPQYQRISQPPAEPQPQYSGNVPAPIQKILQFQAQTPYNIIANQIIYRPDKPYVPQPVQAAQPAAPQYHQGQQSQGQGQAAYGQGQGGIRPVTEKQY